MQLVVEGTAANDDFAKAQPLGGLLPTQWGFSSNRFATIERPGWNDSRTARAISQPRPRPR